MSIVPPSDVDLIALARKLGLSVYFDKAARARGEPHILIRTRERQTLHEARTVTEAMQWLQPTTLHR